MFFFFDFLLRVVLVRNETIIFIFIFFSLFQPISAWNEATMVFFLFFECFWNFYWNFLLGVWKERMVIFIFSLSHHFPTYFGLKWIRNGIFFIFLNFFLIFMEFSITHWVGMKRNDNFYFLFFSAFSIIFWIEMKQ